uniref:Uncharacterized protein n=1 Tax=Megaselia scalaris TaxID=36166 RepID=T1H5P7_MEGSC
MSPNSVASLVGKTTRFIAGRNAVQTVYWRSGFDGKMYKTNKTCHFDKSQKVPSNIQ